LKSPAPLEFAPGYQPFVWGSRTYIMGILNLTPDSFSGDGVGLDRDAALRLAERQVSEGADLLDVGGESTRPGADPVGSEEELHRVVPVIERLACRLPVPISVDTSKSVVARAALAAGARLVNDTSGLHQDPELAAVVAEAGAAVVLMENGRGRHYDDLIPDIITHLKDSIAMAEHAGVDRAKLILDPGLGFGKSVAQNLETVRRLGELRALGLPLLAGPSRKSTIGRVLNVSVDERLEGTAAMVAIAIANGADIVRVHDVRAMVRVARMTDAIVRQG
jgi:dihydropteroate synthase